MLHYVINMECKITKKFKNWESCAFRLMIYIKIKGVRMMNPNTNHVNSDVRKAKTGSHINYICVGNHITGGR